MTFLKWSMLLGLLAVAIPIVLHLLNRSRPRPVEWGAMRFLLASATMRSRRIRIEELLLLCLRCALFALLALAMARPFLPGGAPAAWGLAIPAILIASALAGAAAVVWRDSRRRRALLRTALALAIAALAAAGVGRWTRARRWLTAGGGRDVALVLDASLSMTLVADGKTNFVRAVEEAGDLIEAGRPADAFTVILAGPAPRALLARPTSDRRELRRALKDPACRPLGGAMSAIEAMNAACAALADGGNAAKAIIVITDNQAAGWDVQAEARWRFVAGSLGNLPVAPQVICRRLDPPREYRNAAVSGMLLSRAVIGPDRPVKLDVKLLNAGQSPMQPAAIELLVDGAMAERQPVLKELLPGVTEMFRFDHRFRTPGSHVVRARLAVDDDLAADNAMDRVVRVLDRLPVLIVESSGLERFFLRRSAGFVRVALTPRGEEPAPPDRGASTNFLVAPVAVKLEDFARAPDLSSCRVVVLPDVPRLPAAAAEALAQFVRRGGGLLIAPGARADPVFYNEWRTASGERVTPALLARRAAPPDPLRLDLKTFSHPALALVAEPAHSDAELALVSSCWELEPDAQSPLVRVGGRLHNGMPLLAERQLGLGYVLLTAMACDRRDGNLPSLKCFVPFVHELVYYLAAPGMTRCDIPAGTEWAAEVPPAAAAPRGAPALRQAPLRVIAPDGASMPLELTSRDGRAVVRFAETRQPGLYRVLATNLQAASAWGPLTNMPFTVQTQPDESLLTPLSDGDWALLRGRLPLLLPATREQLLVAFAGEVPGREGWRVLILCALLGMAGEVALTRWIALQRRLDSAEPVTLASPAQSVQGLRDGMRAWAARAGGGGGC